MRVLVTGANGFVGRAVCRALGAAGYDVRAALRTASGSPVPNCENVAVGDIDGATNWRDALAGVEAVVHLAARTHSRDTADAYLDYRRLNVDGTAALATAARDAGVEAFVFMSSIKVHGEVSPRDEQGTARRFSAADPPAPTTPYGQSKLEAETALAEIARDSSMRVVVLRPPLVYGPGHKGNLAHLAGAIARGWPLPLGALQARRSLIGVDNLADAVVAALRGGPGVSGAYTLADCDVSTAELVRALGQAGGRPARVLTLPSSWLRAGATIAGLRGQFDKMATSLLVDHEHFAADSGWSPRRTLADGLRGVDPESRDGT